MGEKKKKKKKKRLIETPPLLCSASLSSINSPFIHTPVRGREVERKMLEQMPADQARHSFSVHAATLPCLQQPAMLITACNNKEHCKKSLQSPASYRLLDVRDTDGIPKAPEK